MKVKKAAPAQERRFRQRTDPNLVGDKKVFTARPRERVDPGTRSKSVIGTCNR